jgi:hypothetical protein
VILDLNETDWRYLYATAATRAIFLSAINTFIFTLTSTSAESPSCLCNRNDSYAVSFYGLAKNGCRLRDAA